MFGPETYIFVFLVGSLVGSFLNVCIYRIPRGLSIVHPPSKCPACNSPVRPLDNIPIVSFIFLGGRCRFCGTKISWRYPFVEFLNAFLYVLAAWRFGPYFAWFLPLYLLIVSTLIVVTFIDLEHQIIPDGITLPGTALALVFGSTILPDPFSRAEMLGFWASLSGLLFGGGLFYCIGVIGSLVFRQEAMGGGDIKLMAMLGGILGWKGIIVTTFLGSLSGSLVGISIIGLKGKDRGTKIPFGPYLALGALFSLFLGEELLTWFLSMR